MPTKTEKQLQKYIPLLCGVLTSAIVLILIHRDYPHVGHDYRYFIIRLIDTKLHLLLNGPSIQWYTPSFGGGLPAYPNPQHIQYSIVQLLSLAMNPWAAVQASTFIVSLIGFMAFEGFLEKTMGFHWTSSTLGAIFFICNGFFIEHMIVGHIGHQLFPLGAVLLRAASDENWGFLKGGSIIAFVLAMMIHQTGFYIIVILALSLWITLPLIHLYKAGAFKHRIATSKLAFGIVLAGAIAGSKIHAVLAIMQFFPRVVSENYPVGVFQAILGIAAQLLGVMFLLPFLLLARQDTSMLSGSLANITGAHFGIWEIDIGLAPVLTILLILALSRWMKNLRQIQVRIRGVSSIVTWVILFIGIWVTIEMTIANGMIYPSLKSLPILRSMHVNIRFAAALIIPLVLVGIREYETLTRAKSRKTIFAVVGPLALVPLVIYNLFSSDVHDRTFNLERILQTDSAIQRGERFPVDHVADIEEEEVFLERATNLLHYEPLFSEYDRVQGYLLKDVSPRVLQGAVTDTDGVYFNMTNPASLVFPKENNLKPFERIKISEEEKLRAFVERKQPDWELPRIQIILNRVSAIAFVSTVGIIFLPQVSREARRAKNRV
jgi:hypothetical protein